MAGRNAPGCRNLLEYTLERSGSSESTLWGWERRSTAEGAALINGMTAHALDLDDTFVAGGMHTGAVIIPAATAAAERLGQVGARDFLAAVAIGVDLACRLSLAARDGLNLGWWATGLFSTLGAVASVGKIMGLDKPSLRHGLGIVYSQLGGNRQAMLDGGLTKRLQCGMASSTGIVSADLAKRGITGANQFLSGPFGLFTLYSGNQVDTACLTRDLGRHFLGSELLCKMYPCCSGAQGPVQATLEILQKSNLKPQDVKMVRVTVPPEVNEQLGHDFYLGDSPQVQAQFNLKYLVSAALVHRRLTIGEIEEDRIRTDRKVLDMTSRVSILTGNVPRARNVELPVTVEIETGDGPRWKRTLDHVNGEPSHPDYHHVCRRKFDSCLRYAGGEGIGDWGKKMSSLTMKLDGLETLTPWIDTLQAAPAAKLSP